MLSAQVALLAAGGNTVPLVLGPRPTLQPRNRLDLDKGQKKVTAAA